MTAVIHIDAVVQFIAFVLGVLSPFLIGSAIAFVLNLPMKFIETKLLGDNRIKSRKMRAARRPISLILTLLLVIGLFSLVILVVVPELVNTFTLMVENINEFIPTMKEWILVIFCFPLAQNETMDVRGRNLVTGLPKTVTVSSEETEEALKEPTLQIVEAVHSVLEKTPPELAADVADRGIVLTGGGSLLRGLEELIEDKTGINTMTAEEPMTCVAVGTGKFVEFLSGKRDDD